MITEKDFEDLPNKTKIDQLDEDLKKLDLDEIRDADTIANFPDTDGSNGPVRSFIAGYHNYSSSLKQITIRWSERHDLTKFVNFYTLEGLYKMYAEKIIYLAVLNKFIKLFKEYYEKISNIEIVSIKFFIKQYMISIFLLEESSGNKIRMNISLTGSTPEYNYNITEFLNKLKSEGLLRITTYNSQDASIIYRKLNQSAADLAIKNISRMIDESFDKII